ncbi:5-formyltetrahydrofolate cyclo-ligase [Winogradskyella sp.]|uniref:5-formyltetrahydrofolate cyclo-ligase n=1 Tax=Winogradskyella sp. TaxID=1883156 RepID=UPI0025EA4E08|nr:5-formyltetrahydrofolate cyclo-ligase [Winogradskyella sp.]
MTKGEIRKKHKALREKLSENQIEDKSLAIANQLLQLDIWNHTFYHIFLPIEEQKEVNTEYILNILAGKDKNIVVSKSNFEDYSMSHFLLTDNTTLKKNDYNIPEPVDGIPISSQQIDIVFVPLLGFDTKGSRVGYGKGFYDRFLSECKPETLKIGLSFFDTEEEIEVEKNDVRLNYCVTPKKVFRF